MSIKQAWSVHIQLNHDKTKGQGTDYGCSNEVWYIEVLFLIFYCVPFNSKTATPPPPPPRGVGGAYTGHLTGVLLRTVVDPKWGPPVGRFTSAVKSWSASQAKGFRNSWHRVYGSLLLYDRIVSRQESFFSQVVWGNNLLRILPLSVWQSKIKRVFSFSLHCFWRCFRLNLRANRLQGAKNITRYRQLPTLLHESVVANIVKG